MRAASKTGGAVGAVSEKEMDALGNQMQNLDISDKFLGEEMFSLRDNIIRQARNQILKHSKFIERVNDQLATYAEVVETPEVVFPPAPNVDVITKPGGSGNGELNKYGT